MEISPSLAVALSTLTDALDDFEVDLVVSLAQFGEAAQLAVSSYLGLAVHVRVDNFDTRFTTLADDVATPDIATSLRLEFGPAPVASDRNAMQSIVLYAGTPGAFVDLAADIAYLLGPEHAEVISLDNDLTPPTLMPFKTSLTELSAINQAIGVLIERGFTSVDARQELERLSTASGMSLPNEAMRILEELNDPPR